MGIEQLPVDVQKHVQWLLETELSLAMPTVDVPLEHIREATHFYHSRFNDNSGALLDIRNTDLYTNTHAQKEDKDQLGKDIIRDVAVYQNEEKVIAPKAIDDDFHDKWKTSRYGQDWSIPFNSGIIWPLVTINSTVQKEDGVILVKPEADKTALALFKSKSTNKIFYIAVESSQRFNFKKNNDEEIEDEQITLPGYIVTVAEYVQEEEAYKIHTMTASNNHPNIMLARLRSGLDELKGVRKIHLRTVIDEHQRKNPANDESNGFLNAVVALLDTTPHVEFSGLADLIQELGKNDLQIPLMQAFITTEIEQLADKFSGNDELIKALSRIKFDPDDSNVSIDAIKLNLGKIGSILSDHNNIKKPNRSILIAELNHLHTHFSGIKNSIVKKEEIENAREALKLFPETEDTSFYETAEKLWRKIKDNSKVERLPRTQIDKINLAVSTYKKFSEYQMPLRNTISELRQAKNQLPDPEANRDQKNILRNLIKKQDITKFAITLLQQFQGENTLYKAKELYECLNSADSSNAENLTKQLIAEALSELIRKHRCQQNQWELQICIALKTIQQTHYLKSIPGIETVLVELNKRGSSDLRKNIELIKDSLVPVRAAAEAKTSTGKYYTVGAGIFVVLMLGILLELAASNPLIGGWMFEEATFNDWLIDDTNVLAPVSAATATGLLCFGTPAYLKITRGNALKDAVDTVTAAPSVLKS